MATAAQVSEFRQANQSLTVLAQAQLRDFLSSVRLDSDPVVIRNALLEFFPELVSAYGDTAALLAADFYDALRDAPVSAASFRAAMSRPVDVEKAQGSVRWAVGSLFADEPDVPGFVAALSGATQRLVLQPGRDTVWSNAGRDPVRTAYARIPVGATCAFCTMVASRGFVYASQAAAGQSNKWHDDCDCVIVPGRGEGDYPEGYDLSVYKRLYREGAGVGRDEPAE